MLAEQRQPQITEPPAGKSTSAFTGGGSGGGGSGGGNTTEPPYIAHGTTKLDPPGADLAYFDASQARAVLQPANLTITSIGGTATVSLKDESSGASLGSQTFPFVMSNNVATFSDPSTVNNWVHSFSTYQGNVEVDLGFYMGLSAPPAGSSGSLTITAEYSGSPYASSTAYVGGGSSGGCSKVASGCNRD